MTSPDNAALLQRLLATFKVEADERLKGMSVLLVELEQTSAGARVAQIVETLFREAHSLKGAARAVNLNSVEMVCASLESELAALKGQERAVPPALIDALSGGIDELAALLAPGTVSGVPGAPAFPSPQAIEERAKPPSSQDQGATAPSSETVRISTAKLEMLHAEAEELLAFKYSLGDLIGELDALSAAMAGFRKSWDKPANHARLVQRAGEKTSGEHAAVGPDDENGGEADRRHTTDKLITAVLCAEGFAKTMEDRLARLRAQAEREQRAMSSATAQLQDDVRQALMMPFTSLFDILPKLVHDLARDSEKSVALRIDNATVEVDRRILEQLKDPVIHLIRNAVDHGIEAPVERTRRNKPAQGQISLSVIPMEGNKVELVMADDGAGIDLAKVRETAARFGLIAPQDTPGIQETLKLIFESGLSTSPLLTDLSGRGLGLAIVREKVERMGGNVEVMQRDTGGTSFRIVLPTMLATFRGLVVTAAGRPFVMPLRNVARVLRVTADDIKTVENVATVAIDGQAVALVYLAQALDLTTPAIDAPENEYLFLALLENAGRRIAFAVDEVLGDQEVQVKGLGPQLNRVPNVAGATVLGAGRVVPVLNVPDLFKSALHGPRRAPAYPAAQTPARTRQSLLVVEDSITSRSLLTHILESAGYDVTTAVDGLDGLTAARSRKFDLVVSDVEMPRMDGFELTARLRQDKKLSNLPVVLVTGLESREDKERGIEVGANAYIVKSSFDQSNLLETIRGIL
ncbi:hybrid sensor histidine kinase/response regulator [Trinickia fusca]|uniref:Chemotaxis protein CheA n=1 Tax=Trinickia fusca TaxID=2419777 RepID=A0A494XE89_9BURK|nr:response regulator [Trinickia fusca]RKP46454.1 hybrid sensor histidine kinase/response regulator [Trinickia fusca]